MNTKCFFSCLALGAALFNPVYAHIPFEQALELYEATHEKQKENSPFWGMVVIESHVLEKVRFFGQLGTLDQSIKAGFPRDWMEQRLKFLMLPHAIEKSDVPLDAVSLLVQHLFRSPDLSVLNVTDLKGEPLNFLIRKKKTIHLETMNKLLECVISSKNQLILDSQITKNRILHLLLGSKKEHCFAPDSEEMQDLLNKIKKLDLGSNTIMDEEQKNQFSLLKTSFQAHVFSHTLVEALKEEAALDSPYPRNICILSLLGYVWKVANHKKDLKALTCLIDPEKINDDSVFSLQAYQKYGKIDYSTTFDCPENIGLFRAGFHYYEDRIPNLLSQKHHVKYSLYNGDYPDCVETAIRNFFYIIFTRSGAFNETIWHEFIEKNKLQNKNLLDKIFIYLKKHPSVSFAGTEDAHNEWSEIISGIDPKDNCAIQYKNEGVCNIKASVYNVFNTLARLIDDEELQKKWSDSPPGIQEKLNRLCTLFSREDWRIDGSFSENEEKDIHFSLNDSPAFIWHISSIHSEIRKANSGGWPEKISWDDPFLKQPLFQMWFLKDEDFILEKTMPCRYIYGLNLREPKTILRAVDFLLFREAQAYYPFFYKWLNPLTNDPASLASLKGMLYGHRKKIKSLFPHNFLKKIHVTNSEIRSFYEKITKDRDLEYTGFNPVFFAISREKYSSSFNDMLNIAQYSIHQRHYHLIITKLLDYQIRDENWTTSKFLLFEKANPDGICVERLFFQSPLERAIQNNNIDLVNLLLAFKADVNLKGKWDWSPLMNAAHDNKFEVSKVLIANKADINAKSTNGLSALGVLFRNYDISYKVAALLIENKADVNCLMYFYIAGETPLHHAARLNNLKLVTLLIRNNALINACDKKKESPIFNAVCQKSLAVVKYLYRKGANIHKQNENGRTPLFLAAWNENDQILNFLLDQKADINALSNNNETALNEAVYAGHLSTTNLLLEKKIDIRASDHLLKHAFMGKNMEIIKILLKKDIKIDQDTTDNHSSLYYAIKYTNDHEIVDCLIKKGASLNEVNVKGKTLLHWACGDMIDREDDDWIRGNIKVIQLLIDAKFDINIKDKKGQLPLHGAILEGSHEVIQFLIEMKADTKNQTLLHFGKRLSAKTVEFMIEHGVDVNGQNAEGETPLHWASRCREVDFMRILIEQKASVFARNHNHETPLHSFVRSYSANIEGIQLLIQHRADPNALNNKGRKPRECNESYINEEAMEFLLEQEQK